jgi:predicted DNA binding protein
MVTATVPAGEFALRETLVDVPAAAFETLNLAAHNSNQPMPLLWATAPDLDAVDDALEEDPTVETVRAVTSRDGKRLYQLSWEPQIRSLLRVLLESGGTLLTATAHGRQWQFDLLFPDHSAASRTYNCCQDWGIELSVARIENDGSSVGDGRRVLSEKQHETLVAAYETDYYGVPRGVTMEELAEHLGVSHQAMSERLRRGHQGLISETLSEDAGIESL